MWHLYQVGIPPRSKARCLELYTSIGLQDTRLGAPASMLSTVALFMCITYRIPQTATWYTVDNKIQVHKIKDKYGMHKYISYTNNRSVDKKPCQRCSSHSTHFRYIFLEKSYQHNLHFRTVVFSVHLQVMIYSHWQRSEVTSAYCISALCKCKHI